MDDYNSMPFIEKKKSDLEVCSCSSSWVVFPSLPAFPSPKSKNPIIEASRLRFLCVGFSTLICYSHFHRQIKEKELNFVTLI